MDTKKKIIIIEDNDLYREALKDLINAQNHLTVVAEAGSGVEAIKIIKQVAADLVLLDLRLPEASGYDVLPEISKSTDAKILVLTILESDHNIRAAFDAGADGYCFKDVSSQELLDRNFECVRWGAVCIPTWVELSRRATRRAPSGMRLQYSLGFFQQGQLGSCEDA